MKLPRTDIPFCVKTGVLIECDPSIKSIIVNIDSNNHEYIIEDLDEERVVVKENMVASLKQKLEDVRDDRGHLPPKSACFRQWPLVFIVPPSRLRY